MVFENFIDPWFKNEMETTWGSVDWRQNELLSDDVNLIFTTNMTIMKALHKKYITRNDRVATYARIGDFLYEDGLKLFHDCEIEVSDL